MDALVYEYEWNDSTLEFNSKVLVDTVHFITQFCAASIQERLLFESDVY